MNLSDRINACIKLGEILKNPDADKFHSFRKEIRLLHDLIISHQQINAWFTPENVKCALKAIGDSLKPHKIEKWLSRYPITTFENAPHRRVAVVMAGNIPLVGFHDYLSVVITGNIFIGKLSSSDNMLLPLIHQMLSKIEPDFKKLAHFTEDRLTEFDAIIATGSNNTSRYFEYYFGKYPNIIRKNRTSIAILNGVETQEEINALGEDIFKYYGLGCRNVSKLYVPKNYDFGNFFDALKSFEPVIEHHKYHNNYDYIKSIYLINNTPHFDNGFLLLTQATELSSPVSTLHYQFYDDINVVKQEINLLSDQIQCVVASNKLTENTVKPGNAQKPELWDYADGIDIIDFLISLK